MAPETKEKKRKAATTTTMTPPAKKSKKSDITSAEAPSEKVKAFQGNKNKSTAPETSNAAKPLKRAAAELSDLDDGGVEIPGPKTQGATKLAKKPKQLRDGASHGNDNGALKRPKSPKDLVNSASAESSKKSKKHRDDTMVGARKEAPSETLKSRKKPKDWMRTELQEPKTKVKDVAAADRAGEKEGKSGRSAQSAGEQPADDSPNVDESDEEDHTAALLEGFDSDDDDPNQDIGFIKGGPMPPLPNYKKTSKKIQQAKKNKDEDHGAVYVGRIPHGFYEGEMRGYFSQFGEITKLRLSRNRKTGASKHFAFIEFASDSVARIVANAMDNYLMFGHILKCKYVPVDSLPPRVWEGANRRFKKVPWNKVEKRELEKPKTKEQWGKKNKKEQDKRDKMAEKMKGLDYEFRMPKLKSPDLVPAQPNENAVEAKGLQEVSRTTIVEKNNPATVIMATQVKKSKKGKKGQDSTFGTAPDAPAPVAASSFTEQLRQKAAALLEGTDADPGSKIEKKKKDKEGKQKDLSTTVAEPLEDTLPVVTTIKDAEKSHKSKSKKKSKTEEAAPASGELTGSAKLSSLDTADQDRIFAEIEAKLDTPALMKKATEDLAAGAESEATKSGKDKQKEEKIGTKAEKVNAKERVSKKEKKSRANLAKPIEKKAEQASTSGKTESVKSAGKKTKVKA